MNAAAPAVVPAATDGAAHAGQAIRQGGLLTLRGQGIKLILQLGATAILARLLTPADFGLMSLVAPLLTFFAVFRDVGLTSATICMEDITSREVSSLFWINVAAGLLLAFLLAATAPLAADFFAEPRLLPILLVMAGTFVLNGVVAQYQALFQREFRFKRLVSIDVTANMAGTLLGVAAAFAGYGYWSLVVIPVTSQFLALVGTILLSSWRPGLPRWEARTAAMTRFGSEVTGFNFLNYFARNLDNLLIGKVWGLESLGYYGRAYGLMMAPLSQVVGPLNQVVVPVLARLNGDPQRYVQVYVRIMQVVMLACLMLVVWLLVAREWIVAILLGPDWGPVVPIFLALGLAALVQPLNNSAGWLMLSQSRSRDVLRWGVIGSTITVLSILAGLPWGALAVAVCYAVVQIAVITPLVWWFTCRAGAVRVRDVLALALPLWGVIGVVGISFEMIRVAAARRGFEPGPAAGLVASLTWVVVTTIGLMALHPAGRRLLGAAAGMVSGKLGTGRVS